MVLLLRSYSITIDRGSRGFGLSLIYRGLDKYKKGETGIFVAKVIPDGQAQRSGVLEEDRILTINGKNPTNVDDAVDMIKGSEMQIKLIITRNEEVVAEIQKQETDTEIKTELATDLTKLEDQPIYQNVPKTISDQEDKPISTIENSLPNPRKEHDASKQTSGIEPTDQVSVKDTVREILESSKFGNVFKFDKSELPAATVQKDTEPIPDNMKRTISRGGSSRASSKSLRDVRPETNSNLQFRNRSNSVSRMTRKEEKSALEGLNNRLAGYIDRVRTLQNRNRNLYHQIRTFEEYKQLEIGDVKELYENQVKELKKALESATKNYDQLKDGAEGLLSENNALREKVYEIDVNCSKSMEKENTLKKELWEVENKLSREEYELRITHDRMEMLLPEIESLRHRLADAKSALDREQLNSIDLEGKCQQLEENLKHKMSLLEGELVDVKIQKESVISTIDGVLHDEYSVEYEDRLQKELQKLRDMYDEKMQEHRDYFEERYQNRYRELQSQITIRHGSTAGSDQELKESRYRIDALLKKIAELEHDNLSLNQKIADMVQEMKEQPVIHQEELSSKDGEMQRIIHQLSDQMTEYQKLHEIKIALDMEIAVFHHLLESEEDRFEEIVEENREDREEPFTIERRTTIRNSERRMMLRGDDPAEIK